MKPLLLLRIRQYAIVVFLLMLSFKLKAQDIATDPGAYMTAITNDEIAMNKTYLAYMSAVAHSGRARKVEKKRQQTLKSIQDCKIKIANLPYFKGDNSLRKSNMDYIDMCYKVFSDDYTHIVNMENLIEQSFDEMQLYILLMEKTDQKLKDAIDKVDSAGKEFARKYNVTVINENDQLSKNMEITSEVVHYRYQLYLLFYKCNWQDGEITKAINEKKLTGLEEARNALDTYAKEGLLALDSLNSFHGDQYLAQTCKQALQFYQKLAEDDLPKVTDFFLKEENFNKIKRAMTSKPRSSLTKQDVDNYNKAVNDYNTSINDYNQLNANINNLRSQNIDNWNNADKRFMDAHIPHVRS
jgi:hypothetical protein